MAIDNEDADALAQRLLSTLGPAETLLLAMRLVVLVGQASSDEGRVLEAAKEAIAGIKRMGALARVLQPA